LEKGEKMERDPTIPWALLIIGIGFVIYSNKYTIGNLSQPGVGFFPLLIGIGLAGWAGVFILQERKGRSATEKEETQRQAPGESILKGKIYAVTAILFAFAALHSVLGYWTSIFGAMVVLLRVAGVPGWKKALLGGGMTAIASYFIFEYWLGVLFPEGWIR